MNDLNDLNNPNELLSKLEHATALGETVIAGSDAETADPETTALRDTWLAFGRLLETADAMEPTALPSIAIPRPTVLPAMRRSRRSHWLSATLLLATASLAAVVCIFGLRWSGAQRNAPSRSDVAASTNATTPLESQVSNPNSPSKSTASSAAKPDLALATKPAAPASSLEWDDADDKQIDEQISAIQTDISLTQRKWDEQIESSQTIEYRISEDEQEISKDPL